MRLFPAVSLLFALSTSASPVLEARAACNADNLLRCFSATKSIASAYCTPLVGAITLAATTLTPTVTVTATAFSTSTTSVDTSITTATTTSTTSTEILPVTNFAFSTKTETVFVTLTATSLTTTVVATTTVGGAAKAKRVPISQGLKARDDAPPPVCLTKAGAGPTSYAPSRVTSACSCIGVTSGTVLSTATAPAVTISLTTTLPITATAVQTITVTSTITVSSTATASSITIVTAVFPETQTGIVTTTTVQTISATATATGAPPPPSCEIRTSYAGPQYQYDKRYEASRFNFLPPWSADGNGPKYSAPYPATTTMCTALQQCANFAANEAYKGWSFKASAFALQLKASDGTYQCIAFRIDARVAAFFRTNPSIYFSVSTLVEKVYLYSE